MKKVVRIYYSSYVDIEFDSEEFKSESEMLEYANMNANEIAACENKQILEHLCPQDGETEIL